MIEAVKTGGIRGVKKGLETTIKIGKILVPVYFIVTFIKYTPLINYIALVFKPVMHLVGLPGEAALPFVIGNAINLYAGIGAILALTLNAKEITIISVMLCFSHSLFLETAVCKKIGVSATFMIIVRQILAFVAGILLNIFL
ncbi:nucleoside recognition domain-containing protein [Thermobrachium celere]|uniref:Nucleoside transporter/FeoB GTPase Gate domain-containing protein n=1 Tax=Thermobrachium celere DSM 8682 TaxID=941824 RepID=R7RSV7_9CLOT|nr:nucleoside recognition domain-containing protein [Thermobrachium celere]GFR36649.1 nucleoside recognition protein [Thermobrachium celere]CDF58373.1 hypothetical protein TCEL_00419 [Thermobrachium celere DSM 8682]